MPEILILTIIYFKGILFLLFCFVFFLINLSKPLYNTGYSYKIYDNTLNHLFYKDDLKLFAKYDQQLKGLLNIIKQSSNDIRM